MHLDAGGGYEVVRQQRLFRIDVLTADPLRNGDADLRLQAVAIGSNLGAEHDLLAFL